MATIGQYRFPILRQLPVSMSSSVMNWSKNTGSLGANDGLHLVEMELLM